MFNSHILLSSPPSSPSLGPVDSSPPSSPWLAPTREIGNTYLPASPSISLVHPYAGSTKATRYPPQYEKRSTRPDILLSPLSTPRSSAAPRLNEPGFSETSTTETEDFIVTTPTFKRLFQVDTVQDAWDSAITQAVDTGRGHISLSDQNITYIPSSIKDLANFYVPPETSELANISGVQTLANVNGGRVFSRVTTAPAGTVTSTFGSSLAKTRTTFLEPSVGLPRDEIQLILANNHLTSLPRELFCLEKMTVLSLRGNRLTYIPPEIALLTGLRELNLSNNQLTFLPSEMLRMNIKLMSLHPNPWLPFASDKTRAGTTRSNSISRALLRPTKRARIFDQGEHSELRAHAPSPTLPLLGAVPPLTELALRVLVAPFNVRSTGEKSGAQEPTLSAVYEMPLPYGHNISEPVADILNVCVPGSIAADTTRRSPISTPRTSCLGGVQSQHRLKERAITGVGYCPSPRHAHSARAVFVQHAEERYTWEETIAGIRVGRQVPVRWRGCLLGCLDFLDEQREKEWVVGSSTAGGKDITMSNVGTGSHLAGMTGEGTNDDRIGEVQVVSFDSKLDFGAGE